MQGDLEVMVGLLNRSELIIEAMKKAGITGGRVGVGNLHGTLRNDEGGVSYTTMARLMEEFPRVRFESAADLLMRVKLARGPEEIEALRLSNRIGELGIKASIETAAPGVPQRDVWFQIAKAYLDASGESPGRITIRAGAEGNTADGRPLNEVIEAGQILSETLSASVLGYNLQVNQTMCVGRPEPANWESTFRYNMDLFEALVDWAKPGRTFADYSIFYKQEVDKRIAKVGGKPYVGVVFHTGGALGDGPRMGWSRDDENSDLVIEPGMVFTIKPRVPIPGLPTPSTQIGDGVLITENGAERLGRRKLEPIVIV
jgi:Xaa-Pro aminopeptidase